jgi:sulfite reductase (ferredoxin)
LARGIYGQRQEGVQMIRIKLPFGRLSSEQLLRIADVSDKYSTGRLHITTRQDIQIHYVSLDKTPELWAELERDDITLREACGNTVRNVTASETAGIDPDEPFDVTPYADAVFRFFLRNPICQELGRKFKISFSSSDRDSALSYMHDLGFIPKIQTEKTGDIRGFKVMIAGGLGSQPRHADTLFDFLEADRIIPLIESVLRIFDRHGERNRRARARLKHLIANLGLDRFRELLEAEQKTLSSQLIPITVDNEVTISADISEAPQVTIEDLEAYKIWKSSNVINQKQAGRFAIGIKVRLGDFFTDKARSLAHLIKDYASNEIRLTIGQGILIRHVPKALLPFFYERLKELGFSNPGYQSTLDITSCPGTDTCNLGIASSTGLSRVLETTLLEEFPQFVHDKKLNIKISGCMNSCGQHSIAAIGFYGMSIKNGNVVIPGFQILLGGSNEGNGKARFADKVIKIPSKRGPSALRILLTDYEKSKKQEESFADYYKRKEKSYFYQLLKPLADMSEPEKDLAIDWGHSEKYVKAIGVGECAGVVIDLVTTLLFETEEKLANSEQAISDKRWADSIYHSYSALVNTAKAVLIGENIKTNTQVGIIQDFDKYFVDSGLLSLDTRFSELIYQLKNNEPTEEFAKKYRKEAKEFYVLIDNLRKNSLENE